MEHTAAEIIVIEIESGLRHAIIVTSQGTECSYLMHELEL